MTDTLAIHTVEIKRQRGEAPVYRAWSPSRHSSTDVRGRTESEAIGHRLFDLIGRGHLDMTVTRSPDEAAIVAARNGSDGFVIELRHFPDNHGSDPRFAARVFGEPTCGYGRTEGEAFGRLFIDLIVRGQVDAKIVRERDPMADSVGEFDSGKFPSDRPRPVQPLGGLRPARPQRQARIGGVS